MRAVSDDRQSAVPRLSDDELKQFVLDFLAHRIFSSAHMPEAEQRNLGCVFLPIALGAFQYGPITDADLDNVGLVYEYLDAATDRAINGMPTFFSFRVLHREDWKIAAKTIDREIARLAALELELER